MSMGLILPILVTRYYTNTSMEGFYASDHNLLSNERRSSSSTYTSEHTLEAVLKNTMKFFYLYCTNQSSKPKNYEKSYAIISISSLKPSIEAIIFHGKLNAIK